MATDVKLPDVADAVKCQAGPCDCCRWWDTTATGGENVYNDGEGLSRLGECHKRSPQLPVRRHGRQWPTTRADAGCGEWKARCKTQTSPA